ncbi:MAG: DNA-directed RNA polymerase subunit L [Desulfurococcaceae archaeon TW002]
MKIRRYADKELVLEIEGEDHTLANLLAKSALSNPHTKLATYVIEHPLIGTPILRIVTDGTDPLQVLKEVVSSAREDTEQVLKVVSKALGVEE